MNAQLTMIFLSPFSSVNRFCYSHPVALRKFAALFSVIQNWWKISAWTLIQNFHFPLAAQSWWYKCQGAEIGKRVEVPGVFCQGYELLQPSTCSLFDSIRALVYWYGAPIPSCTANFVLKWQQLKSSVPVMWLVITKSSTCTKPSQDAKPV